MNRRSFLKAAGLTATASVVPRRAPAGQRVVENPVGVLIDTTRCVGCRTCEVKCAEANGLPEPDRADPTIWDAPRETTTENFTVVTRSETSKGKIYAKRQCMHCLEPACTSVCLTQAMSKSPDGPVHWDGDKCMGCRYCMVSCPFDVPRFEYGSTNPRIRKCTMCWEKVAEGQEPACAANCPMGAIKFGDRAELLVEARRRIAEAPDAYVNHIYGEREVGGTGVLYLSKVPFDELGFRTDLGEESAPQLTKEFLYSVPFVLTMVPPFLVGLNRAVSRNDEEDGGPDGNDA